MSQFVICSRNSLLPKQITQTISEIEWSRKLMPDDMTAPITGETLDQDIYKRIMELAGLGIEVKYMWTEGDEEAAALVRTALHGKS
jgi:hypothetical protein